MRNFPTKWRTLSPDASLDLLTSNMGKYIPENYKVPRYGHEPPSTQPQPQPHLLNHHITTHQKHDRCKIVIHLVLVSILTDHWTRLPTPPSTRPVELPAASVAIRESHNCSLLDSIWWIYSCGCGASCKCWRPRFQAAIALCLNIQIPNFIGVGEKYYERQDLWTIYVFS